MEALVSVEELARLLCTTRKGIYHAAERGQLPGVVRIGKRLLFRREHVRKWLDEKTRRHAGKEPT